MNIFINDKKIETYFFDNEDTLLKKYTISIKNSDPSFFRITTPNYILKDGIKLTVEDIRNHIDYTIEQLYNNESILTKLINLYTMMTKREIILLVLIKLYGNQDKKFIEVDLNTKIKYLKSMDSSFSSVSTTLQMMDSYTLNIKNKASELATFIKKYENYIKSIDNLIREYPVECNDLFVEEITLDIVVDIDHGIELIDIFDAIIVSQEIPLVYVYYENKFYSKTYKNIKIPEEWLDNLSNDDNRLYFKILNSKENITEKNITKIYSNGWWDKNNNIEISLNTNLKESIGKTNIDEILFFSLGDRIGDVKIIKNDHSGIRSIFKINNFNFNKVILADMVDNDELMSFFLFLNEYKSSVNDKTRTITTKNRFMIYFSPGVIDQKNSLSITLTPNISDDKQNEWVMVRISKSKNYNEAETFREIFSRLLSYYQSKYNSVIKIYKDYLPKKIGELEKYIKKPKLGGKEDKKTGKRLKELISQRPYVFRSGSYSGMCQPMSRQPFILPKDKVEGYINQYGEHKVMKYQDPGTKKIDYYACEPREEGEPETHIFPGLRENTSKNQTYKKEVPDVPCCFTEDQYTKPASKLRKLIQKGATEGTEEENLYSFIEEENVNDIGHILGFNKSVSIGRFGQLPYYMNFILKSAGYTEFEKGKQMLYPIFRYGILQSPDSFFHCLEKAKNKHYSILPKPDRIKLVYSSREKMAAMNMGIVKQEFYDYTEDNIRNILLDKNAYIDPGMWFRLAEEYYNVNIFIFQTSQEFPNGAIVYPRFSKVHLRFRIKNRDTVLIMKNTIENDGAWPFQCELFAKFNPEIKKGKKISFYFDSNDKFIKEVYDIYNKSNKIYTIDKNIKYDYSPINSDNPLLKKVTGQYIDDDGKTRVLFFDRLSICVSPIPPLNVEVLKKVYEVSLDDALKFIEKNSLTLKYYNKFTFFENKSLGLGISFEKDFIDYGYIFILSDSKLPRDVSTENLPDPIRTEDTSRLELVNRNKKIASILMQHTLYDYSNNPSSFSKDNFVVVPSHIYDISQLSKMFKKNTALYSNKKLIVQSEEMREKLLSYLEIQLLNDTPGVLKYKNRIFLTNFYKKITDFRQNPKQNIFIGINMLKESTKHNNDKFKIIYKLLPRTIKEPYFYKNYYISNSTLFLVQNVHDNTLEKSLGICKVWAEEKINPGYGYNMLLDISLLNYEIYSETGLIKKALDYTIDRLMVIKRQDKYSALLPIL